MTIIVQRVHKRCGQGGGRQPEAGQWGGPVSGGGTLRRGQGDLAGADGLVERVLYEVSAVYRAVEVVVALGPQVTGIIAAAHLQGHEVVQLVVA